MKTKGFRIEYKSRLAERGEVGFDEYYGSRQTIFNTKEEALKEARKRLRREGEDEIYIAEIVVTDKVTMVDDKAQFTVEAIPQAGKDDTIYG